MTDQPVLFIIAGEASGDLLGGRLMAALKQMTGRQVEICGIGGARMQEEGLQSLFPMEDLSVMGLAEVVPQLPVILRRLGETEKAILSRQPDAVITIDAPDFCFRIAKRLKKKGFTAPCIHYVAPSVWAWRPKRAEKIAKFLDHLLCFLPFEPPYFERHGLKTTYVGHSVVEDGVSAGDGSRFRKKYGLSEDETLFTLLPGSRKGELDRHLDLFIQTAQKSAQSYGPLTLIFPCLPHMRPRIEDAVKENALNAVVIDQAEDKYDAFSASDAALAASGTVALELGVADVPTVIAYRMSPVTSFIARRVVKTRYVSLVNIILDRAVMPEYLLDQARVDSLSDAVLGLLSREESRKAQKEAFAELRRKLNFNADQTPSQIAARTILDIIS